MIAHSQRVADHVAGVRYEDLPPQAVARVKTFLLDTIGVGIAGSSGAKVADLATLAATWGGAPEASVWLTGQRMSAGSAAMVNAYQIHCLEYDCVHEGAVLHPMATILSAVMAWAERAGPGSAGSGDITAVFSVLVAGSDMEETVADILRGVLDGHVVMDRKIAERGRYPAIDLLRSVSRSLPQAATAAENSDIATARRLLGAYDRAELMIQAGLYSAGSDPLIDDAIRVWPALDAFLAEDAPEGGIVGSFVRLQAALSSESKG